jgi:hypothetical protein
MQCRDKNPLEIEKLEVLGTTRRGNFLTEGGGYIFGYSVAAVLLSLSFSIRL